MDTTTDGLVTRSAARTKRIIIFYLFPLSNVDEDACVVFVWWLMELPSHQLPLQKMSADVIVPFSAPVTVGSQVEQSRIPSSSTVLHRFSGRFQLSTKVNSTTAATAFTLSINYEDMPVLVSLLSYASDDGDM